MDHGRATSLPDSIAGRDVASPRLLIVSNRLPVTVKRRGSIIELHDSVGGLATGLRGPHGRSAS